MTALFSYPWWLLLLALIGVVTIISLIVTLFTGVGDRPDNARLEGECTVDSEQFLRAVAGTANAPIGRSGTARLLNNGEEFYPAIFQALREAQQAINLLVYIWEPGRVSDEFFEILTERARAGVQVRVMVDGLGGHKAHDENIEALRAAGGQWAWFHPPRFGMLTRMHKRNHRRAIIIDGEIGFTGGAAVMDKWMGNGLEPDCWRDCMVEVHGALARNLQPAFTSLWTHVTGEMLVGPEFYGDDGSYDDSDECAGAEQTNQLEEAGSEPPPGEPISRHISVIGSPSTEAHPMRSLFWLSFRAACESIYVTNPYFVPDEIMCELLVEWARSGVDVRILVPGEKIDVKPIRWASRSLYEPMLEAGVRIYEYQPAMIHQKVAVIDGQWSLVGSVNMDVRSKELNQENALGILDRGFARQVTETFFRDLEHAEEVELETFRRRPVTERVLERFAGLFEEQY